MSKSPVSSTGKVERASKPQKGRMFCDKKGAASLAKKQLNHAWPISLAKSAASVQALNIDTSKTCINNGKSANFFGHLTASKSAAVDTVCLKLANGEISFTQFNIELASQLVIGAKRHDAKALKAKLAAHCRHYNGKGKVSFQACLTHAGLVSRHTEIAEAMYNLLNDYRATL